MKIEKHCQCLWMSSNTLPIWKRDILWACVWILGREGGLLCLYDSARYLVIDKHSSIFFLVVSPPSTIRACLENAIHGLVVDLKLSTCPVNHDLHLIKNVRTTWEDIMSQQTPHFQLTFKTRSYRVTQLVVYKWGGGGSSWFSHACVTK